MLNQSKEERHATVYATPRLPAFEFCKVLDRVWVGRNPLTAVDVDKLENSGITHILDLREEKEWTPPRFGQEAIEELANRNIRRKHISIPDTGAPTDYDLDRAYGFISEALEQDGNQVYVHCRAGQERSGAILVAYCAKRYNCNFERAVQLVTATRPTIVLLRNQEEAVRDWL